MALKWNGEQAKQQTANLIGEGLLRAAIFFKQQHQLHLNVSNPRPYENSSQVGEYPRARTGFGRSNVWYDPQTVAAVVAQQKVKIGYLTNAWYMAYLEVFRNRLGLKKTLETYGKQLGEQIKAVTAGATS